MKKKYLLNGKVYDEDIMTSYAQKSGLSLTQYLSESGATEYTANGKGVDKNKYRLNGKDYDSTTIDAYAKKSGLSFDEYVNEAGVKKKEAGTSSLGGAAIGEVLQTGTEDIKGTYDPSLFSRLPQGENEIGAKTAQRYSSLTHVLKFRELEPSERKELYDLENWGIPIYKEGESFISVDGNKVTIKNGIEITSAPTDEERNTLPKETIEQFRLGQKLKVAGEGLGQASGSKTESTPIMQIDWSKEDPVGDVIKSEDEKIKKDLSKSIIDLIAQRGIPNAAMDLADRKKELDKVTNSAFPTGQNANDFLTQKLSQKGVVLKPKQTSTIGALLEDIPAQPIQNLNDFDLKDIAASINPENATEIIAFNKYKKDRNIDETIKANGISEEAALNFAASQDATVAAQLDKIKGLSKDRYDAYAGQLVFNFLNDPDVVNKVRDNPELKNQWLEQEYNLYTTYPTLAKRIVAQKISQKREDLHKGGVIVDIPTKAGVDEIVNDMLKNGDYNFDLRDKNIYDTEIRPKIGALRSVGRGIGNVFIPAFTNDAPIETTDLLGTLGESYKNTVRSMAHSVEDVANTVAPVSGIPPGEKIFDKTQRLVDLLQKDYSTVAIDPKSFWSEAASSTGHLTGFVLPMVLGGSALGAAGFAPRAANLISQGLTFEGMNKDASLKMFPDNSAKQFLYTTIATGGDLMLGELLPTKEAAAGIKNTLRPEITKIVNEFTDGNITAAAAKKTLTDRAATLIKQDFPNLIKGNIKTGAVMTGFNVYHNALDAAFGGRDITLDDAANEAIQSFKSGFLGSTPLTALGLIGENNKIKGSSVREMAFNRDYYKQVIEDNAALHPELEATKNERISNLNDAQLINKDLQENSELSEPKKQKYLLTALAQKVWQKRAEAATDETIKNDYENKAAELGKIKEQLWSGADKAAEYESDLSAFEEKPSKEVVEAEQPTTAEAEQVSKPIEAVPERTDTENLLKQELIIKDEKGKQVENYRYEDVTLKNPFTGEEETLKAYQAKPRLTERYGLLKDLLKCLD